MKDQYRDNAICMYSSIHEEDETMMVIAQATLELYHWGLQKLYQLEDVC